MKQYKLSDCHEFPLNAYGECSKCWQPCKTHEVTADKYGYTGAGGFFVKHDLPEEEALKEFLKAKEHYIIIELVVGYDTGLSCLYYEDEDITEKVVYMSAADFYKFSQGKYWYSRVARRDSAEEINEENKKTYVKFLNTITPKNITQFILPALIKEQQKDLIN